MTERNQTAQVAAERITILRERIIALAATQPPSAESTLALLISSATLAHLVAGVTS